METQEVLVSKAAFPLRKGETLEMFTRQLRDELCRKYEVPGTRDNDWRDEIYVYTKAVLPGRVIFRRSGRGARDAGLEGLMSSDFTRDESFHFNFSNPVAVIEEKDFVPIQKSADFTTLHIPVFWSGLPVG
jgi:hypothetical protein